MKKLLALMAALLIAAPAFAADNLELSGSFFVKGWDISNSEFADGDDASFFKQRLRIKSKIKANDNTYIVLRADYGEGKWGKELKDGYSGRDVEVNRVFAVLDRDMYKVTAGLQFFDLGMGEVVDAGYTGVKLDLKFDGVTPTLFVAKLDENGSMNDDGANDDANFYAVNVNFGLAELDANLFYALSDDNATDAKQWGLGFNVSGKLAIVDLVAEIATFGGDNGPVDYVGTQAYVKASADVNDMVSVGGELLYALGADDNEVQITGLSNVDSFNPIDSNSPIDGDVVPYDGYSPFSISNAGVMGLTLFGEVRPMEALGLGAKMGYYTAEDDVAAGALETMTAFNAWVSYAVGPNTDVSLTYVLICPDYEGSGDGENMGVLQAKFAVNF